MSQYTRLTDGQTDRKSITIACVTALQSHAKNRLTVLLSTNLIKGTDRRMETGDHEPGCDKMRNANIDVEWG